MRKLALMDWYTSYELQVRLLAETTVPEGRNALHGSVLDVFNEFNVQIMSPNFVLQPKEPVVVVKENWYAAPAAAPEEINKKRVNARRAGRKRSRPGLRTRPMPAARPDRQTPAAPGASWRWPQAGRSRARSA